MEMSKETMEAIERQLREGVHYKSTIITYENRISAPDNVRFDIASVTLDPGNWLLSGEAWFVVDSGSPQLLRLAASISPVSLYQPTEPTDYASVAAMEPQQPKQSGGVSTGLVLPLALLHLVVTTPTPYYLSALVDWSGTGAFSGFGKIAGRLVEA